MIILVFGKHVVVMVAFLSVVFNSLSMNQIPCSVINSAQIVREKAAPGCFQWPVD